MLIGLGTCIDKVTGETIKTFEFKGTPEEVRQTYEKIWQHNFEGGKHKKKKQTLNDNLYTPMTDEENTEMLLRAIDDIDINLIDLGILH